MDLSAIDNIRQQILGNMSVNLPGGFVFQPSYLQAGLIVFLIFLLVLTLGQLRHRMNEWAMKGLVPGIAFGFVVALIIEGLLLVGGGTILTQTLGWKSAPKPISDALDQGRGKLINVLGTSDQENKQADNLQLDPEQLLEHYNNLSPSESDSVNRLICE